MKSPGRVIFRLGGTAGTCLAPALSINTIMRAAISIPLILWMGAATPAVLAEGGNASAQAPAGEVSAPSSAAKEISPEELAPLEKVLDAALAAYNADDRQAFCGLFATDARPPMTRHNFRVIFQGIYLNEFGPYVSKRLLAAESNPDPEFGQIVYDAVFAKRTHVKVSANLVRESGVLKLAQLRFEKL